MTIKNVLALSSLVFILIVLKVYGTGALQSNHVRAAADTCIWEGDLPNPDAIKGQLWGAGVEGSNTNWNCSVDGQSFPQTGDKIVFKQGATGSSISYNDLSDTNVYDSIYIEQLLQTHAGNNIKLSSANPITLINKNATPIHFDPNTYLEVLHPNPELYYEGPADSSQYAGDPKEGQVRAGNNVASITYNVQGNVIFPLKLNRDIDVIKKGSGTFRTGVKLDGSGLSFKGKIVVEDGGLEMDYKINGFEPSVVTKADARLQLNDTVAGKIQSSGRLVVIRSCASKGLELLNGSSFIAPYVGTKLSVTGVVALNNSNFDLNTSSILLTNIRAGSTEIIVDNDGKDAIQGLFNDISEGKIVSFQGKLLKFSYKAGDGNDIGITSIGIPVLTLASFPSIGTLGEKTTLTTTVKVDNTPIGGSTIEFFDKEKKLGSAIANSDGIAVLEISSLEVGEHSVTATSTDSSTYGKVSSNTIKYQVLDVLPSLANEEMNSTEVIITVTDENNIPVKNQEVILSGEQEFSTITDEGGKALFAEIPQGNYLVSITRHDDKIEKAIAVTAKERTIYVAFSLASKTSTNDLEKADNTPNIFFIWAAGITVVLASLGVGVFIIYKRGLLPWRKAATDEGSKV